MTKPQAPEKAETFAQFWRHYLRDHAQAGTRVLHFVGTGLGVAALILGIVTLDPMIAILGMVLGYVFAWSGHFLIERNRPSMLAHPVWSFRCDVRMLRLWLGGRLNEERARRNEPASLVIVGLAVLAPAIIALGAIPKCQLWVSS